MKINCIKKQFDNGNKGRLPFVRAPSASGPLVPMFSGPGSASGALCTR